VSDPGSISMHALQRVDSALGGVACALLQPLRCLPTRASEHPSRKVLAIKFWGLGSLQLLTPAVASLRRKHPFAEITFLTLESNRELAERLGVFDRVLSLDVRGAGWARLALRIRRLLAELRGYDYDVVYDFEFFTRFSSIVSLFTGAPRRHGFESARVWRGAFHTDRVQFNRYWHVARNFRVLAGGENGLNVTAHDTKALRFDERDEARAWEALERAGVPPESTFAVLNPNAGELSLERRWPASMFIELGQRLAAQQDWSIVLIGSKSEHEYTEAIRARIGTTRVANLAGRLSTPELAAVFAQAAVVVSNDSGPMHIAAAMGAPTLGLFGPETPVMYGPIGLRARALYRPPPCSPCINVHDNKLSSCIWGEAQCLVGLSVDEVHEAALALADDRGFELDRAPRRQPRTDTKGDRRSDPTDPHRG
jgi:heptosyltransferase-3